MSHVSATPQSAPVSSGLWRVRHSAWLLAVIFGFGFFCFTGFLYCAIRVQSRKWWMTALITFGFALVLWVITFRADEVNGHTQVSDASGAYLMLVWAGSIAAGFALNRDYLRWRASHTDPETGAWYEQKVPQSGLAQPPTPDLRDMAGDDALQGSFGEEALGADSQQRFAQHFSATPRDHTRLSTADLTRYRTPYCAHQCIFTAVDIETTGLDCEVDRIVEIGLVKFMVDGTIIDEFATLVNSPGSCPEAREKHGIEDADLVGAPNIADALHEAFAFMNGTVLVAHNFEFENGFLAAAAKRASMPLPDVFGVCTLSTSRCQLDGRAYSLTVMYKTATDEFAKNKHTALGDARSVREVLLWLLNNAPTPLYLTSAPPAPSTRHTVGTCQISCRPVELSKSAVADLLASFPQSPFDRTGDPVEVANYLALLTESVEDGLLTFDEAKALTQQARRTRLTGTQLRKLHRHAWDATFHDSKETPWAAQKPSRRREMYLLADALGLTELATEIHKAIEACAEPPPSKEARYLRGLRIGILGDDDEILQLRQRAEHYGAKLAKNITKTVQWLATMTPDATDSRHTYARTYGISILTPAEASDRLDDAIRDAELKAFERQREADTWAEQRRRYKEERDAYWRPTWRNVELDDDPGPEYRFD